MACQHIEADYVQQQFYWQIRAVCQRLVPSICTGFVNSVIPYLLFFYIELQCGEHLYLFVSCLQAAVCRCSQPLSGFSARCLEDEHMLQAISKANHNSRYIYVMDTRPKVEHHGVLLCSSSQSVDPNWFLKHCLCFRS